MSEASTSPLVTLERQGAIARITIQRPKALNALNSTVLRELDACVAELERDADTRVVIVCGSGDRSFVAGADIAEMVGLGAEQARDFATQGQRVFSRLEALPQMVIAEVQGFALGGGLELAMACDWMIASSKALFGQPEIDLGIIPGFGGTQRLSRRIGAARARDLIATGRRIGAEEARSIGLVDQVHAPEALRGAVEALAATLAAKAPLALRAAKRAIAEGVDTDLASGLAIEARSFGDCFGTEDAREGLRAFLEKRPAEFRGR
ncbi:MAG: enoyl-CoA hydratase-related protein [bacterium]